MKLGISLYPDQSTYEEDQAYIALASSLGYTCVFMSFLQIDLKNPRKSIQRIRESTQAARQAEMEVILDIHPMVFSYLPSKEDDLSYFYELGVSTLRLDSGYDGRTEAMMTHNPYGINIELNVSRDTHELQRVMDYHPDLNRLKGSHNFYPQRYTGLEINHFKQCTDRFLRQHLSVSAFITSQSADRSPWPVTEGLCTLEDHRSLSLRTQLKHLKMMKVITTAIIGNAFASETELRTLAQEMEAAMDVLTVELYDPSPLERSILFAPVQEYRGDASAYVIRSTKHRAKLQNESLPAHHTSKIHRGDVLILNEQYGQYKGELQIALHDRKQDPRINVVGRIKEEELILLDELQPFQMFQLQEGDQAK